MTKIAATARGFRLSPSIGRCSTLKTKTDAKKKKKKKGKNMNQVLPEMMMKKKKKKKNQVEPEMKEKQGKKKKQVEPEIIKAGDYVNISDLLFTKKRDYLVKFNGDKVKAEHLAGKVIIIYFGSLSYNYLDEQWATKNLIDLYTAILPKNLGLEVVWVPIIDNKTLQKNHPEEVFKEKFAYMPWPCIPYSDLPSGERLLTRFGQFELPSPFIIDPTGKVLHCFAAGAGSILLRYGVEAFPFSYERMQSLISEDEALEKQISLKTLLATPERDYLISNKGKQVPIGNLEDKVVALYLYEDGLTEKLTRKLKRVYKQLAKRRVDFEVVLVYLHSTDSTFDRVSEDSFNKRFKNMPWLALPFKDPKCMKVARIFDYPYSLNGPEIPDPTLVIIGPHGKFVGIFDCDILMNFGIEAYPFTRERVLELETEKAKKLKLNSLLDPNVVLRGQDGSKIKVSKLMIEKRVLLIIETTNVIRSARFLAMLKEKYLQKKSKDDEFEVIHICLRTEQSAYNNEVCGEDFPWLLHHFHDTTLLARQILGHVFMYGLVRGTALVAFERGGMLVSKAWRREFVAREDMDFPFAEDLEKEIWRDMNVVYNFDYYEDE